MVGVVIAALVARTLLPVPVLVTLTSPLEASVATAEDAVRLDRIGWAVKVATPVTLSVPDTFRLVKLLLFRTWNCVPS